MAKPLITSKPGAEASGRAPSIAIQSSGACSERRPRPPESGCTAWPSSPWATRAVAKPARWVSRSSTVIGRGAGTASAILPVGEVSTLGAASSGSHWLTLSDSRSRPSSTKVMAATVTIGLVIEPMRNRPRRSSGAEPASSAAPITSETASSPWRCTSTTAPGISPRST